MSNPVWLYIVAWLLPLASFLVLVLGGRHWGKVGAYVATAAIIGSFVLSFIGFVSYTSEASSEFYQGHPVEHDAHYLVPEAVAAEEPEGEEHKEEHKQVAWHSSFSWIPVGDIDVRLGFYVDNLTAMMFLMVTFIASLIHIYSAGYMHDELHEPVKDPLAVEKGAPPLERKGRYPRFFTYLSLFCFSMLGLVLADNILFVFVFWELVGICSFFLIGFYYERNSASTAANKAFITNRVGDAGMIVGLMIILSTFHTFSFTELSSQIPTAVEQGTISYLWLTVAGIGIFTGCVGKSAQFPLHVWLPDAMEGPTPVSALIHAATMVAAGVYLVGRFYFLFTADALLVIAYTGAITLFMAGTIAMVMTDIKKVLAYSTVSQLGYMMLGLGVGGWAAGLFHLITHAFFKALLFLDSGSVIHGTGTQEMPEMGGLRKKMPITCWTMFIGVLAISGIPFFSGYYSKDSIIAHCLQFGIDHPSHPLLMIVPVAGAAITSFYMFRLFFMTFTGTPRDKHVYDHAHESPWQMWLPLVVLAGPSIFIGYSFFGGEPLLVNMLSYQTPVDNLSHPSHDIHALAGGISILVVVIGITMSVLFYWSKLFDPAEIPKQFPRTHRFLANKWYFDDLYSAILVKPALRISNYCSGIDRGVFDRFLDGLARSTVKVSKVDGWFDFRVVDGLVNLVGDVVFAVAGKFRYLQTGRLRQYLVFLVVGSVAVVTFVTYVNFLDPEILSRMLSK